MNVIHMSIGKNVNTSVLLACLTIWIMASLHINFDGHLASLIVSRPLRRAKVFLQDISDKLGYCGGAISGNPVNGYLW